MNDIRGEELGELVKKLMNDPQVADLVNNLKEGAAADGAKETAEAALRSSSPRQNGIGDALAPLLGSLGGAPTSMETENRNRLLAALKPYLSPERREIVDRMTSLSRITSLLDAARDGKTDRKGD